jgi:outer membrane protein assembly factor BamB
MSACHHVEGIVYCEDADNGTVGLAGVAVSDGEQVISTDENGRFALRIRGSMRPVFISTPSGYRPCGDFFRWPDTGAKMEFKLVPDPGSLHPECVFAILADYQWEPDDTMRAVFERLISDPARPQFTVHLGDLFYMMEGAPLELARRYYQTYRQVAGEFRLPTFNLIGNHDQVSGPAVSPSLPEYASGLYERVLGPTYYSFDWGQIHFVVLNPFQMIEGVQRSRIGMRQLRWLEQDLASQPLKKPLILLTHRAPMQWENEADLLRVLGGRQVLACFCGDWHRDAVFRCPGEPFTTVVTVAPLENIHWMPPGYRIVKVRGNHVEHTYRLMQGNDELFVVRPAPGSRVGGDVELVVTEHLPSAQPASPSFSGDGNSWSPLSPDPLPGERTSVCEAYWARWSTTLQLQRDTTLQIRASCGSCPSAYVDLPLEVVASSVVWRRSVAQGGDVSRRSQPTIAGDRVVLGEDTGVRAFALETGQVLWEHREPGQWWGTPSANDERVIATSWEGHIVALALADGQVAWRTRQPYGVPPSRPCLTTSSVILGGMPHDTIWGGSLTCLDVDDGRVRWRLHHDHPFFAPALCTDRKVWAACGDRVYCVDETNGEEIWCYRPEHFSLYGSMVIAGGRLFAPDIDGWTYVLDPETGVLLHRFLAPRGVGFASDGHLVFAACGVRGLRAYEPNACAELWSQHRPGSYFASTPTIRGDEVIAGSSDGNIYAINKANGCVTWSHQLGDVGSTKVAADSDMGFLVTGGGELVAFSLPAAASTLG